MRSDNLEQTLQVFSHFFVDPLLSEDRVNNEINAVNNEYEIDVSDDSWKLMNLLSLLSEKTHPMSRFTIGSTESLQGAVPELKKFFRNNYSSNLMSLVVKTNKDLDKLEQFVRQSDLELIDDKDLAPQSFDLPIRKHLGSVVKFHQDSTSKQVLLAYQIPVGKHQYYHTKPLEFLDQVSSQHLKNYILQHDLGVDYSSELFMEEDNFRFYVIEVTLSPSPTQRFD